MNLPVGEVLTRGINFREFDSKKLVESFYDKQFSGYLIITLEGYDGFEEGVTLFRDGLMVGAFYEYDLHGVTVFGDSAIPHVFNAFAADFVAGDIVSLTNQQVDLVIAFHDKAKLKKAVSKGDVAKLVPKIFSKSLAESVLSDVKNKKDSKKDIFKKLGLSGLGTE